MTANPALSRWRMLLGAAAETACGGLTGDSLASEAALDWLYGRDAAGEAQREQMTREGGSGPSSLSVPDWVNEVHRLFPKETIERLERDAVVRYGIVELVTDPKVLERLEPNPALLEAVLRTRHANARNFDAQATLRANLKHYDPQRRQLGIQRALDQADIGQLGQGLEGEAEQRVSRHQVSPCPARSRGVQTH